VKEGEIKTENETEIADLEIVITAEKERGIRTGTGTETGTENETEIVEETEVTEAEIDQDHGRGREAGRGQEAGVEVVAAVAVEIRERRVSRHLSQTIFATDLRICCAESV